MYHLLKARESSKRQISYKVMVLVSGFLFSINLGNKPVKAILSQPQSINMEAKFAKRNNAFLQKKEYSTYGKSANNSVIIPLLLGVVFFSIYFLWVGIDLIYKRKPMQQQAVSNKLQNRLILVIIGLLLVGFIVNLAGNENSGAEENVLGALRGELEENVLGALRGELEESDFGAEQGNILIIFMLLFVSPIFGLCCLYLLFPLFDDRIIYSNI